MPLPSSPSARIAGASMVRRGAVSAWISRATRLPPSPPSSAPSQGPRGGVGDVGRHLAVSQ
eukprot:2202717-Lingulodinium_polyedra.AAC.1